MPIARCVRESRGAWSASAAESAGSAAGATASSTTGRLSRPAGSIAYRFAVRKPINSPAATATPMAVQGLPCT